MNDVVVARPVAASRTRALFVGTIFLGSFLLFLVQPMFARLVLPRLGGAPAVWNTALLFYQATLLVGYLWAHGLARLPPRMQPPLHLALFAAAALTLPIAVADVPEAWRAASPAVWLIGLFALSIGPAFLAVAAQAPLMQAWFARTGQPPWFLYAASNAGSLLALVLYPLAVEPLVGLVDQTALWSAGYVLLALAMAACGLATWRLPAARAAVAAAPTPWSRRLRWGALAAIPSGLLISTTAFLTTDVMAMPLLWMVPLILYLLTFIMAYSGAGGVLDPLRFAPVTLVTLGSSVFLAEGLFAVAVGAAGLVLFFYVALALHGELARLAPEPARLTEYYLWIALGGVVGGALPAFAPLVFDWTYEHPLLLVLAALMLPARPLFGWVERWWQRPDSGPALRWALPALSLGVAIAAGTRIPAQGDVAIAVAPAIVVLGLAAIVAIGRPARFAWQFACLLLALGGYTTARISTMEGARVRSFFGVYEIKHDPARGLDLLMHGTTLHGAQATGADAARPTTYYAPTSGVGRVFAALPAAARVGVVGLGTGTLACYAKPGQAWTFYEIDPAVVTIARDRFSYLRRCAPGTRVEIGDARVTLAAAAPGGLDALAVDAFSSDAIPLHLMTREAFAVYARALAPDGVLLIHVSNRFVDLEPVVAALAGADGWAGRMRRDAPLRGDGLGRIDSRSDWIVLARDERRLQAVLARLPAGEWARLRERPGARPWTDDFASVLAALK